MNAPQDQFFLGCATSRINLAAPNAGWANRWPSHRPSITQREPHQFLLAAREPQLMRPSHCGSLLPPEPWTVPAAPRRSEERRVGKECKARGEERYREQ